MVTVIRKTCERISDSEGQVTDLGLLHDPLGKGLSPPREGGCFATRLLHPNLKHKYMLVHLRWAKVLETGMYAARLHMQWANVLIEKP